MSLGRRLIDLAKANLNALLDKAGGETAVDQLSDEELQAELERRKARRLRESEELEARKNAERAARERGAQRKRMPPPRRVSASEEKRLRDLYAQLEVPYGAPFEDVKKSFRRLMRKYHPDLHVADAKKHATATQLTMALTQAYGELEKHLTGGRIG
jgi:DnaJ-domain-containing protein 1